MDKESYVKKAIEIHGDRYSYDAVPYEFKVIEKIPIKCNICGETFKQIARNHTANKSGCPRCGRKAAAKAISYTFQDFVNKSIEKHGGAYEYYEDEFVSMTTKTLIKCKICGNTFAQLPTMHVYGNGCSFCNHFPQKLDTDSFKKKLIGINKNLEVIGEYHGNKEYIDVRCKVDGNTFKSKPNWLLGGSGCKLCNVSKMELTVREILARFNFIFFEQKKFDWLGKKSLDFYIPSLNIAIECQGEQHFRSVKHFGGDNTFLKQVKRDIDKHKACMTHGIKIIYVLPKEMICHVGGFYNESNTANKNNLEPIIKDIYEKNYNKRV